MDEGIIGVLVFCILIAGGIATLIYRVKSRRESIMRRD